MRIEKITLNHLSMPLVSPFETSFGRSTDRECLLITIQSEGITGYGECVADRDPGYSYETTGTAWHILKDFIIPTVRDEIGRRLLPANMQFKLNDLLEASRRWTDADLRRALEALGRADRRMKREADPATTLVAAVVASCGGGGRPTSPRPGR